ncbi:uncharacterized protein LOC135111892 [Scylla paramamosain]|uniref:uncharacterized protein LOC135111892 n=1 Tax=Scylla paramamosain TaxID=85552 RepID=UPI003083C578
MVNYRVGRPSLMSPLYAHTPPTPHPHPHTHPTPRPHPPTLPHVSSYAPHPSLSHPLTQTATPLKYTPITVYTRLYPPVFTLGYLSRPLVHRRLPVHASTPSRF